MNSINRVADPKPDDDAFGEEALLVSIGLNNRKFSHFKRSMLSDLYAIESFPPGGKDGATRIGFFVH